MVNINVLKKVPIFSQLKERDLEQILSVTIEKKFKKGSIIFMEGEDGVASYFIKEGKVKIYKTSRDGKEFILNIYGKNDVFAEVTIFNDVTYPATAEVVEDATLGIIINSELEKLIRKNSDLGLNLIKILNKRLYNAQRKLKQIALNDTYSRTAETLLRLAKTDGVIKNNGDIELKLEISRQELANMIGTARETVSRILSQFNKEGIISISGKKIIIKDREKLKVLL